MLDQSIIAQVAKYWGQLSKRDQLAVKCLSGFLIVLILTYSVLLPSYDFHQNARNRHTGDALLLEWLKHKEPEIRRLRANQNSKSSTFEKSLLTVVTQTSRKYGLTLKRVQPESDNKLRFWVESSPIEKVLIWIADLEESGFSIDGINIEKQDEPGMASIRATVMIRT